MSANFATTVDPEMSSPRAKAKGEFSRRKDGDDSKLRSPTLNILLLGTSIPTADLPGIGASMRMPGAARFNCKSSVRLMILLTFTPGAGVNSYLVTAGPQLT